MLVIPSALQLPIIPPGTEYAVVKDNPTYTQKHTHTQCCRQLKSQYTVGKTFINDYI